MRSSGEFSNTELRILWCIKRRGGKLTKEKVGNIYHYLADDTGATLNTVRTTLRELEKASVVLRHFTRPVSGFAAGANKMLSVELVDPKMHLPAVDPIPLAVIVARENNELAERTAHEPDTAQMLNALVDRVVELQQQIDKLQSIVVQLNEDNEKLRRADRRKPSEHLTGRVRDVLTPEQWEKMRHEAGS